MDEFYVIQKARKNVPEEVRKLIKNRFDIIDANIKHEVIDNAEPAPFIAFIEINKQN